MKMINKETVRIGAVKTELDAARIYDFLAILTEGLIVSAPILLISIALRLLTPGGPTKELLPPLSLSLSLRRLFNWRKHCQGK